MAYFPDTNFEEISFDYSANGADVETGGVVVNMIPREGGNRFSGSTFTTFTFPVGISVKWNSDSGDLETPWPRAKGPATVPHHPGR